MSALLSSFALFGVAWIAHVVWWRYNLPRHQTRALVVVFTAAPLVAGCLWVASGRPELIELHDLPGIAMFYLGAIGCYLIAYTAVEETSPSLTIIRTLEAAGNTGCSLEELSSVITESNFVKPRLEALRRDGMVTAADGGFVLTRRGRQAAQTALLLSRIFNIQENA